MQTLSEKEILRLINRQEPFSAIVESGAFSIRVDRYVPAIFTAIHAGNSVQEQLLAKLALEEEERRYEEDPFTGDMLASFPIVLEGLESRYQYDLNRHPDSAIYEEAWGKKVWAAPLTARERQESILRHHSYYKVLHTLLSVLEKKFHRCIVYDLHSYNHKRLAGNAPLFNIGTHFIDKALFQPVLSHLKKQLVKAEFLNLENRVAFDDVFAGKGYQAAFIHEQHSRSLCVPLEVKKVYMDETTGELYPLMLEEITGALKQALSYNGAYFSRKFTRKKVLRSNFFAEESSKVIKRVDTALYRVAKGIDTLRYINPVNLAREKKAFFAKHGDYTPQFRYRQLKIDPFAFRKRLYAIPVDTIQDVTIRQLYRNTIDMLAQKIDLLTTIGTDSFLYNSLRFHGEPDDDDIALARFLLAAPAVPEEQDQALLSAHECAQAFQEAEKDYGFDFQVELSSRLVARAMVASVKRKVLINSSAQFTGVEIQGLIHHELGVHMVTTCNAKEQPLNIFRLGLPGNTETQEGLALMSEYLSGNLTLARLQTLAHRVVAVHMMVKNHDFSKTCKNLVDDYGLSKDDAFNLTVRVYRGGGFTKDYLYLTGLRKVLQLYRSGVDLGPLFVGKTSIHYLDTIKEMSIREVVAEPKHSPNAWQMQQIDKPILDYLLSSFR